MTPEIAIARETFSADGADVREWFWLYKKNKINQFSKQL
jgi:hypothetical protein